LIKINYLKKNLLGVIPAKAGIHFNFLTDYLIQQLKDEGPGFPGQSRGMTAVEISRSAIRALDPGLPNPFVP